jgi:hypothetical protein
MSHFDELEARKCTLALESKGFDAVKHGYCITFDGKFQKTYDATSVLQKDDLNWHYFSFERGNYRNHAYFFNTNHAMNFFYWHFASPSPDYLVIYNQFGKGSNAFVDQVAQEKEAFEFACVYLKIPSNRYHIEIGETPRDEMASGWVCRPSELGWSIVRHRHGVDEILGDFQSLPQALSFMFWSLTGAQTYQERYAEVSGNV